MKNEKILKRPKSGKPFLLRPLKTSIKDKFIEKEQFNNLFFDNKDDYTNRNIGKNKFIDSFINKDIKSAYNDELENNLKKFNDINSKKDKLKSINLIEKNIEDLYDWSNLLNNSRPISCYTLNHKPLNLQKDKKNLKHTVIECKQNIKNMDKINIKKKRLLMAMHSPRNNSFYFSHSKTMSNFFKKNKINIAERAKFLKPKLKSNSFKLKNQIKTQRILSARKEKELSNKLNSDEINLEKKDLITATERKNPFPLLQSIFKQIYYQDDNDKLYTNNTIKTSRIDNNNIDKDNQIYYDKNDNLLRKEKYKNKSDIFDYNYNNSNKGNNMGSGSKLILSYYNKDDAYIQIFNRIFDIKNKDNNDIFNTFNDNENIYNPILQNFDDNFNPNKLLLMKKNIQNKNNEKKEDDLNINNNSIINKNSKNLKNIRPKTGFRPSNNIINNPWDKKRQTSNINKYKESIDQMLSNHDPSTDIANSSKSNSFLIKTLSNAGNSSYDKINKILKEKKLNININNIKYDDIKPSKELKNLNNNNSLNEKRNIKKNLSFNKIYNTNRNNTNKIKNNNKWNNDNVNCNKKNKKSLNVYDFGDVVNNLLNENDNKNLYTLNYYKSMGGKYYSSSNNVNVKKIRNEKNKK